MNRKELKQAFKTLARTREGGAVSSVELESGRRALLAELGEENLVRPRYRIADYLEYVSATLLTIQNVTRPIAVGFSSIVLALGGWVVAVNASAETTPGDSLYPVKLATERVQIGLAGSTHKRAKLRIEFAGRRLAEVDTIKRIAARDQAPVDTQRIESAIASFEREIARAEEDIKEVAEANADDSVELVDLVERKTKEFENTLVEGVGADVATIDSETVASAKETVRAVNKEAQGIIVDDAEARPHIPETSERAADTFIEDMEQIRARMAIVDSRLEAIEQIVQEDERFDAEFVQSTIAASRGIREDIIKVDPTIASARSVLVAGGFRKTFELIDQAKKQVVDINARLARLEIDITTYEPTTHEDTDSSIQEEESPHQEGEHEEPHGDPSESIE